MIRLRKEDAGPRRTERPPQISDPRATSKATRGSTHHKAVTRKLKTTNPREKHIQELATAFDKRPPDRVPW